MRIISGKYKSRRIQVPPNFKARPTTDFAKENLFNVLNNRLDWEETSALDLFSGTGSIAFELVSRGCPIVTSIENNVVHYNFIVKAKEQLQARELNTIKADVFKYLQAARETFDFIFADPPYDLAHVDTLPLIVFEKDLLKEDGLFVLEHSKNYDFSNHENFAETRCYGSVNFSFFLK